MKKYLIIVALICALLVISSCSSQTTPLGQGYKI